MAGFRTTPTPISGLTLVSPIVLATKRSCAEAAGLVYDNWAAVSQMSQNIEGDWPGIGQLIATNLNVPGGSTHRRQWPSVVTLKIRSREVAPLVYRRPRHSVRRRVNWHYDPAY